jgi:hypothetical protein
VSNTFGMPRTTGKLWRTARILAVCEALVGFSPLGATEKHWIAHEAQVIVVGTFNPSPTSLWFDSWHINGVIEIDEVVYGGQLPRQISFQFECRWKNHCQWWPPPQYPAFTLQKGLWFLRRIDQNTWESANGFSDPGFRYLSDRAYWENYIRLYKR